MVPDFHTAVQQAPPQAAARVNRSYERFVYWVFVSAHRMRGLFSKWRATGRTLKELEY